jgi:hypothetical protein
LSQEQKNNGGKKETKYGAVLTTRKRMTKGVKLSHKID